jgi:hypothetical protein
MPNKANCVLLVSVMWTKAPGQGFWQVYYKRKAHLKEIRPVLPGDRHTFVNIMLFCNSEEPWKPVTIEMWILCMAANRDPVSYFGCQIGPRASY